MPQTHPDYTGFYQMDTFVVEIMRRDDGWYAAFAGTPPGFEIRLSAAEQPHTFTAPSGPAAGAPMVFHLDDAGDVTKMVVGGEYTLVRLDGPPPDTAVANGQGLISPELVLDAEKEAAFAALLAQIEARADGALIDYALPYPKYEFLMYAAMQDKFIFHGSGKGDIDEFITRRTSMELNDRGGRGNVQGIYGTQDGLWPLFFAVVDRAKLDGTIRNGVNYFQNDAGDEVAVYQFSINQNQLAERPYRPGTLYILPRTTFRRMPASAEGGLSNEWVSEVPVKPLARLTINPDDFPFLEQIGGHDDSQLIAMQALGKQVMAQAVGVRPLPDGFSVQLNWDSDTGPLLLDYIPRLQQFIPTARLAIRFEPEEVWFDFFGPPAVNTVMLNQLREQGVVSSD